MQQHPVLYVDVDGVISLWGFDPNRRPPGSFRAVDGLVHFLSQRAGAHLLDLARSFELVWCTGWEERANEHLVEALGLPRPLPWLELERHRDAGERRGHWKLGAVVEHAGNRPVAWIDDAFNDACRLWAAERERAGAPTLLVATDPPEGLVDRHADRLRAWAAALR